VTASEFLESRAAFQRQRLPNRHANPQIRVERPQTRRPEAVARGQQMVADHRGSHWRSAQIRTAPKAVR
jgi:hypothetical protein